MANTGYKIYATLLKETNDGTHRPLDINNNLCSESGLPQASKPNNSGDPDYIAPVYDVAACPLPCPYRFLMNVSVSAVVSDGVVTLSYVKKNGTGVNQTWTPGGSGEEVFFEFGVGECVVESSVGIDVGNIIAKNWNDSIACCP